jgi:hypothetical protein
MKNEEIAGRARRLTVPGKDGVVMKKSAPREKKPARVPTSALIGGYARRLTVPGRDSQLDKTPANIGPTEE